jgi:hypothetical protein
VVGGQLRATRREASGSSFARVSGEYPSGAHGHSVKTHSLSQQSAGIAM